MGYLVFNTLHEAQAANEQITANMVAAESNRADNEGRLISVSVYGNLQPEAIRTTAWSEPIELTNNRFAIPAPPLNWMQGINTQIVELTDADIPEQNFDFP